jgi:ATPase subunit of ABC transporter with duplicated ATPase domains
MAFLRHTYKSFPNKTVLEDVNLAINAHEVIALIGENGAGKTTLLQILRGELKPDAGNVQVSSVVGYVPQEAVLGSTIKESFSAMTLSWQIDNVLDRVGLGSKELSTPVSTLSGGQKTRLAFAAVLAQDPEPTLLLLDEPTNNLDADGLVWLEEFIRSFNGAVLLVSHDRQFVNNTATKIAELHNTKLKQYGGDYDFYREQKELEQAAAVARYQQNIEERNHLTKAIRDQRDKGKHTHEHIKRSDNDKYQRDFFRNRVTNKFGQQARALEKRLDQLEDVERPELAKGYAIVLGGEVDSSKLVLQLNEICKSFPEIVLNKVDLEIRGGERIHVEGSNGCGKTTLLKIAAGRSIADSGQVTHGNGISVGYFSQDVDGLDHRTTGLNNLLQTEAQMTNIFREARSLGLTDTDLKKPVSELSRGQQAKLGFAKLLLNSHHLLILDEPTNHLDIPTREQIESALQQYRGTILFASHDKYFAQKLSPTKTLEL